MHILLLNYEFPPAGGGAGFATYNIGRELVKMGVEVDILTSRIIGEPDGAILDGMKVYRVPSWRKGIHDCGLIGAYSYVGFALKKRISLLKENNYDLEHYFFSLPTGILTLSPLPRQKPGYIVSLRGSDVPGYDLFNTKLEKMHRILLPVTRRIWKNAETVVALSQGLKDIALKSAPDQEVTVIPNGIEIDHFYPASRKEQQKPDSPLKLITVSRLLERKGIHHLLEAIAGPNPLPVSLDIVGTGSYESRLRQKCTELGLDDRVNFIGFVLRDELPELYRQHDLFVLPSQTESFGLVFAEAMACGLPILGTFVGGIPELVRDGKDGILTNPAAPGEVRKSLQFFLDNPEKLAEMGMSSRQRIKDKYSWSVIATRYLQSYEKALTGGKH
jgi:glycosyltransferase involved in cell wall biosynthesis